MKGIILAGGTGSRLYPATKAIVKQLLPIYDKPMIYYPLSVLMLAGIREILIISTPSDLSAFNRLFKDGRQLGLRLFYKAQTAPRGLADAFIVGENFIGDDSVCLILGDNLFFGQELTAIVQKAAALNDGAIIFGYPVKNPQAFNICEFDEFGHVISINENPENPKSNYAVPGLYFCDNAVIQIAKNVKPSESGKIELSSVNNAYIKKGKLTVELLGKGMTWFNVGDAAALQCAGNFVETIQNRQGFYISCLEEIAWRQHFISDVQLRQLGQSQKKSEYGQYILNLTRGD